MIERGRIVMIEWGEYSDRVVAGYFEVLKSFDPHVELASHVERRARKKAAEFKDVTGFGELGGEWGLVADSQFIRELESAGYIKFIPCDNWFISSCGRPSTMEYTKNDKCNSWEMLTGEG